MCVMPFKGFKDKNGRIVCVKNYNVKSVYWDAGDGWRSVYDDRDFSLLTTQLYDYIEMPCRKCPECYAQMRSAWISRACAEAQLHDKMLYLTLTYDEDNVPVKKFANDDGEFLQHQVLCYRDFQLFMKSLRKKFSDIKIRFFMCGEYGGITHRPHYHAILYGLSILDLPDLEYYQDNDNGNPLYLSETMQTIWKRGLCVLGDCAVQTVAYVAGYVAGKMSPSGSTAWLQQFPEFRSFVRSSLSLGREWFEDNIDHFRTIDDYKLLPFGEDSVRIKLTDNWKRLYEESTVYGSKFDREEDRLLKFDERSDYYKSRVVRRVDLIDPLPYNRKTDMSLEEYNSSRINHFRNSYRSKRGGV